MSDDEYWIIPLLVSVGLALYGYKSNFSLMPVFKSSSLYSFTSSLNLLLLGAIFLSLVIPTIHDLWMLSMPSRNVDVWLGFFIISCAVQFYVSFNVATFLIIAIAIILMKRVVFHLAPADILAMCTIMAALNPFQQVTFFALTVVVDKFLRIFLMFISREKHAYAFIPVVIVALGIFLAFVLHFNGFIKISFIGQLLSSLGSLGKTPIKF